MTAVRLAEEFDFELVLQHCTEGYRIADELAKRKIPVSLTLVDSPGGKPEVAGLLEENAAILDKAGVKVAINTDDSITESRFFLRTGAIAVRGGMSEDAALKALTLHGAEMLHLDDRVGSLTRARTPTSSSCPARRSASTRRCWRPTSTASSVFDRVAAARLDLPGRRLRPGRPRPAAADAGADEAAAGRQGAGTSAESAAARRDAERAGRAGRPHPHGRQGRPSPTASSWSRTARSSAVGPRDRMVKLPDGHAGADGRRGHAGPDRRPFGRRPVRRASTCSGRSGPGRDERSEPGRPARLDGFNPNEPLLEFLRENGVTVVHAMPGRANVIAGQTGIFRTDGTHRRGDDAALPGRHPGQPRRNAQAGLSGQAADHAHGHGQPGPHRVRPGPGPRPQEGGRQGDDKQPARTPSSKRWAWPWSTRCR